MTPEEIIAKIAEAQKQQGKAINKTFKKMFWYVIVIQFITNLLISLI